MRASQVRNTKVFTVLNPTSAALHFMWEPAGAAAAAAAGMAAISEAALSCLTRHGTIAAGQRAEMAFEFSPASPEPLVGPGMICEALQVFQTYCMLQQQFKL